MAGGASPLGFLVNVADKGVEVEWNQQLWKCWFWKGWESVDFMKWWPGWDGRSWTSLGGGAEAVGDPPPPLFFARIWFDEG
jgi:hypothetical protein